MRFDIVTFLYTVLIFGFILVLLSAIGAALRLCYLKHHQGSAESDSNESQKEIVRSENGHCQTCRYAERDRQGRFLNKCAEYGNCSIKKYEIEQMQELLNGAVVSKFISADACSAFRDAVSQCIAILESE